jgi:hypothetical protein
MLNQHHDHAIAVEIIVDGMSYRAPHRQMTGAAIKALAGRPPANVLYHIEGRRNVEIQDDEYIDLHEHERFITVPPVGGAG